MDSDEFKQLFDEYLNNELLDDTVEPDYRLEG